MLKQLEKISSVLKFKNPWWEYKLDDYIMPDGNWGQYHYVHTPGSTFIIPRLDDNRYVMTRQFRYLNRCESLEFPGGGLKKGVDPLQNAKNELSEEAGYIADSWTEISGFNPYNGVTDEICHVFLAESLSLSQREPEPSEEFEIITLTETEIFFKINKGEIWDGMTLAAWSLFIYSNFYKKS